MTDEIVKVCDLPLGERQDLISLFRQCKLSGNVMTMTKVEAEKLINEAMLGGGTKQPLPTVPIQAEVTQVSDNTEQPVQTQKPEAQIKSNKPVAKAEEDLLKCPRCYSPVKGKKCGTCGLKF